MSLFSLSTWSILWAGSFSDFFTISTFFLEHSFMVKSLGWWVDGGPCDFCDTLSPKNPDLRLETQACQKGHFDLYILESQVLYKG